MVDKAVLAHNLFLALQEAISLAAHWLADDGVAVPHSYGDVFAALGRAGVIDGVIDGALADRLRAAAGLRNLVAHQYGILDSRRVFVVARDEIEDLLAFCQQLSVRTDTAEESGGRP